MNSLKKLKDLFTPSVTKCMHDNLTKKEMESQNKANENRARYEQRKAELNKQREDFMNKTIKENEERLKEVVEMVKK